MPNESTYDIGLACDLSWEAGYFDARNGVDTTAPASLATYPAEWYAAVLAAYRDGVAAAS